MPHLRISEAAALLGVSDDTVRRWIDAESVPTVRDAAGRTLVDGVDVAAFAARAALPADPTDVARSARNRFTGIVTRVQADGVMAQVDLQCGPHRVVSLMSAEAVRELALEPGSVATAVVKATTVIVETPAAKA
ncbi:TOBE domain-containing protein [Demequina mangrovi]|uniref:Molybdenum-pterin binding domain-containing protein n=1 Tax=Demequina mangrovi TaxID=1043493 RepID=A0A1H6UW78_9MICO|nr:TOBE domain-containing protein [Demequina mangrovi]SEI96619.1 molybdenum-pterin binding domain-containing protein [Demequina mangrovi]